MLEKIVRTKDERQRKIALIKMAIVAQGVPIPRCDIDLNNTSQLYAQMDYKRYVGGERITLRLFDDNFAKIASWSCKTHFPETVRESVKFIPAQMDAKKAIESLLSADYFKRKKSE